jgi:alpha-mannosidase
LLALKIAEQGDEVLVRLVELDGKPAENVRNRFAAPITPTAAPKSAWGQPP